MTETIERGLPARGCCGYEKCFCPWLEILALIFPPAAVACKRGCCTLSTLFDFILTLFGWIPGVLFAYYVLHPVKDVVEVRSHNNPTAVVVIERQTGAINGVAREDTTV
jgi:uncharacterized membrane protein YqaE (UPF0057 family)